MPTLHPVDEDLEGVGDGTPSGADDSEMHAPRFFYYLGKWPDDYARAGWSPARVREDLAARRWRGPLANNPGLFIDYLIAEGLQPTPTGTAGDVGE